MTKAIQGLIYTLRRARKAHKCAECSLPIELGEQYYEEVIGGGGLGSLKFPDRFHVICVPDTIIKEVNHGRENNRSVGS